MNFYLSLVSFSLSRSLLFSLVLSFFDLLSLFEAFHRDARQERQRERERDKERGENEQTESESKFSKLDALCRNGSRG